MGIFKTFKTDEAAEKDGIWKDIGKNDDGTTAGFRLRRMAASNPEYQAKIEHFAKTYKTELNLDLLTEEQAKGPLLDAFVDTVLVDWRHVKTEAGEIIEYSKENAKKLMLDLPDLYLLLRTYATTLVAFQGASAGN